MNLLFVTVSQGTSHLLTRLKAVKSENGSDFKFVYIAGKVTGLPYKEVFDKFQQAKTKLLNKGYFVINPCDFIQPDEDWKIAMSICFTLLPAADYIYLLDDWKDSKGAILEKDLADKLGINVLNCENHD
ncbi:MAG TPA: DUF4406 domain-containing protein [Pedobacter sp.]|uniref:DUF4406 domain-containing protein n=1 Tax=Pedobacter sp. TaxID=1411316 RepID=UPI002B67A072|nr:DUF4406 domain-containing protein [Pedobacter sp.]HMI03062.1 DUF4406 domain-containing protein [Pedobacter sp.]